MLGEWVIMPHHALTHVHTHTHTHTHVHTHTHTHTHTSQCDTYIHRHTLVHTCTHTHSTHHTYTHMTVLLLYILQQIQCGIPQCGPDSVVVYSDAHCCPTCGTPTVPTTGKHTNHR